MKTFKTWKNAALLLGGLLLTACTNYDSPAGSPSGDVEQQLQMMTLREKVGQMFYVRPEALDTTADTHYGYAQSMKTWDEMKDCEMVTFKAGADIVLDPRNYVEAFDAVMAAVKEGTISEARINESVRRILTLKNQIRKNIK